MVTVWKMFLVPFYWLLCISCTSRESAPAPVLHAALLPAADVLAWQSPCKELEHSTS